jgi:NTE family protein
MSRPAGSDLSADSLAVPRVSGPVHAIPGDDDGPPTKGTALCLSGGGYRAMLFHLGVLWRLNEAGWLEKLDRISSPSFQRS